MFVGSNTLELNEATMQKAIEHYLNTQVLDALAMVKVTSVVSDNQRGWKVCFEPLPPAPQVPNVAEAA